MGIIVETDLGRDPDDLFAILYLISAGADIKGITISPGDKDQVSIAKFITSELGLNIPIGAGEITRNKKSSGGIHYKLLNKYKFPLEMEADGLGSDIIITIMNNDPNTELFAIGPLTSVGKYLENNRSFSRSTMQGGFVSYDLYRPDITLDKFENLTSIGTFNMNGNIQGVQNLLSSNTKRSFVGKNICHTVIYDKEKHKEFTSNIPKNRSYELFAEAMNIYMEKHKEKKFHDPTAAVCHLHPEIGMWYTGQLFRDKGGWGTKYGGNDKMLVDIDREKLWELILNGK